MGWGGAGGGREGFRRLSGPDSPGGVVPEEAAGCGGGGREGRRTGEVMIARVLFTRSASDELAARDGAGMGSVGGGA